MVTLEELRREISQLKAEKEVREDFRRRDAEKRQLQTERRKLKHPRLYKAAVGVSSFARTSARGVSRVAQEGGKAVQKEMRKKPRKTSRRKSSFSGMHYPMPRF